jgi:hypothetical protein
MFFCLVFSTAALIFSDLHVNLHFGYSDSRLMQILFRRCETPEQQDSFVGCYKFNG